MGAKNYMDSSKLEQLHVYKNATKGTADYAGGFSRDRLRERLGMKPVQKKIKKCLKCEQKFESFGERLCRGCA